jgi:hypothetical protein
MSNETGLVVRYVKPFPTVEPPKLNTDEMKVAAKAFAEKYTGLVVTRENYAEGKTAAAQQNAVITQLKAIKTELKKKAEEIVKPALAAIDEVIEIVEPPYKALKSGLDEIRDAAVKEKVAGMMRKVEEVCKSRFPEMSTAFDHLKAFVDGKCAEKRDGWLVKRWTLDMIGVEIDAEAERMEAAMKFINDHMKGKTPDMVKVAKTALVTNGFNELLALAASDKYEKVLEEQRRMSAVKSGKDPDAERLKKAKASDPVAVNEQLMEATVKFTSTVAEMRKLVAVIKKSGVKYEVIDQHIVNNPENK